jgi:hypothetical protein
MWIFFDAAKSFTEVEMDGSSSSAKKIRLGEDIGNARAEEG